MTHEIKDTRSRIQQTKRAMRRASTRNERDRWARKLNQLHQRLRRLERAR